MKDFLPLQLLKNTVTRTASRALLGLGAAVVLALGVEHTTAPAKESAAVRSFAPGETIERAQLPPQAHQTLALIYAGGPFPHKRDGITFSNRERLLPKQPRGWWREYTVPTPGLNHRGARRIVCGGTTPTNPESCYWTADHYASFALIVN